MQYMTSRDFPPVSENSYATTRLPSTRNVLLLFIMVFCLLNQWMRWLPVYLSSVSIDECEVSACLNVAFTPLCHGCSINSTDYTTCSNCHTCRTTYHSEDYNLQDGVCMTTTQYGIVTGIGFAFTFSLFGLFAGVFVDRQGRRDATILGCSALLCSIITVLTSYCTTFHQLLLLRLFLGAFQAFGAPASVHLIMSNIPDAADRPLGNASYTVGVYLGAGFSSLSSLVSARIGWRLTVAMVGCLGVLVAVSFEVVMDDALSWLWQCGPSQRVRERTASENESNPLLKITDSGILDKKASPDGAVYPGGGPQVPSSIAVPILLVGSCLRFSASIITFVYIPILITRRFSAYSEIFSIFNALVILSCGSVSAYFGGRLGQLAVTRMGMGGLTRLIALSCLVSLPPIIGSFLVHSFWACMFLLALGYLLGEAWMGASMALLQGLSPPSKQGLSITLYLFLNWVLSAILTDVVGLLDPGTEAISLLMVAFVAVPVLLSGICFMCLDRVVGISLPSPGSEGEE